MLDPHEEAKIVDKLRESTRRHKLIKQQEMESQARWYEDIRKARQAGLSYAHLMLGTELSRTRLDRIINWDGK